MCWLSVLNFLYAGFISQVITTAVCVFILYKCTKYLFGRATSEESLKPGVLGRRLGYYESMFDTFSVDRRGTGNVCLTVSITSKHGLARQHVHDALVLLAQRQPMLRAVITTMKDGDKYFEIKGVTEVIKMLDIATSDVKASDWKDIWFEYTAKQLGNGLLWRVVILREEFRRDTQDYANTLMFSFNHSSTDGVSCVKFCKQFLGNMNELANGTRSIDEEMPSLNMLPYYHDIVKRERTWHSVINFLLTYCGLRPILRFFMLKMVSRLFKTMKRNPYYTQFPPNLDVSSFVGTDRLVAKVFTENETKNILKACKANNCTVTGALTAAAHLAFCELIKDGMKGSEDAKMKYKFAINGRRCCNLKPHEDYLGLFVYMFDELYMKYQTDAELWELARATTKQIQDAVKAEVYVLGDTMIESTSSREVVDLLDRETLIRISVCNFISSFGSFDIGQDNDQQTYKLLECFVNSISHGFPATFAHYNHTINGKMTWQIIVDASKVETPDAEKFANLCFARFIEIASGKV